MDTVKEGRAKCLHAFAGHTGRAPKLCVKSPISCRITQSDCALVEAAMRAVTFIMSDDLEGAEAGLANGNSAFHKVPMIPASP